MRSVLENILIMCHNGYRRLIGQLPIVDSLVGIRAYERCSPYNGEAMQLLWAKHINLDHGSKRDILAGFLLVGRDSQIEALEMNSCWVHRIVPSDRNASRPLKFLSILEFLHLTADDDDDDDDLQRDERFYKYSLDALEATNQFVL